MGGVSLRVVQGTLVGLPGKWHCSPVRTKFICASRTLCQSPLSVLVNHVQGAASGSVPGSCMHGETAVLSCVVAVGGAAPRLFHRNGASAGLLAVLAGMGDGEEQQAAYRCERPSCVATQEVRAPEVH